MKCWDVLKLALKLVNKLFVSSTMQVDFEVLSLFSLLVLLCLIPSVCLSVCLLTFSIVVLLHMTKRILSVVSISTSSAYSSKERIASILKSRKCRLTELTTWSSPTATSLIPRTNKPAAFARADPTEDQNTRCHTYHVAIFSCFSFSTKSSSPTPSHLFSSLFIFLFYCLALPALAIIAKGQSVRRGDRPVRGNRTGNGKEVV